MDTWIRLGEKFFVDEMSSFDVKLLRDRQMLISGSNTKNYC